MQVPVNQIGLLNVVEKGGSLHIHLHTECLLCIIIGSRGRFSNRTIHGRAFILAICIIIGSRGRFSNPFLTNWQAYQAALRPEDLPSQAQAMLQRMRQDYQQLLAPKLHAQVEETVTIALRAREAAEETPDEALVAQARQATGQVSPLGSED